MKITKRKWEDVPPLFFHRDKDSGRLIRQDDREHDYTDELFRKTTVDSIFIRSLQNRLLRSQDKEGNKIGRNEITELVENLCKGAEIQKSIDEIKDSKSNVKALCDKTLTDYGKSFAAEEGRTTLYEAILNLAKGNAIQKAMAEAELKQIHEALKKEKEDRINRVQNSIKNNKIPLKVNEDGTISANNDRASWLLELLKPVASEHDKGDRYPVLTEMEGIVSFDKLCEEVRNKIHGRKGRTRSIAMSVDEAVKEYLKELWKKHADRHRDMRYYFQAVKEYFKENFPIRTKQKGAGIRQSLLKEDTVVARLLDPKHMAKAVRRKLINQSTQMHILYGKLYEYCCRKGRNLPVNSETLQLIQVLEAVKKQLMTAVSWSVSRLCYFYEFYIGDILLAGKYRRDFLIKQNNNRKDIQACKEKLQDFFQLAELQEKIKESADEDINLTETITNDALVCNKLLEECAFCISKLRNNIFHYKNLGFTQALKHIANEIKKEDVPVLLRLYKQDCENLNNAFASRISSMNIPLYYSTEFLLRIFKKQGVELSLYSAKYQMTPSFKRVYERGKNLRLEYERESMRSNIANEDGNDLQNGNWLRWFSQLKAGIVDTDAGMKGDIGDYPDTSADLGIEAETGTNTDAQRAMRNLLQLIYKYHFLPEVQKKENIVTDLIPKVLERNRKLSEVRNRSDKTYGYKEIEELCKKNKGKKDSLSELLKDLQRKVSETEKENQELAREKTDYAQRFILDIFAEAFSNFMDDRYEDEYQEIMNPKKDEEKAKKWAELFTEKADKDNRKDEPLVLKTSFDKDNIEKFLLVLYPLMRLLDDKELSELQQQMLRFRASVSGWQGGTDFSEDIAMAEKIEELAELVKLTEPESQCAEVSWKNRAIEVFEQFVEGKMAEYGAFYLQSDTLTPVPRRNMKELLRSGIMGVFKKVLLSHMQATKKDYGVYSGEHWNIDDPAGNPIKSAEQAHALLQRLHNKYTESPSQFSYDDHKLYDRTIRQLDEYNQAKKNLSFGSLYEVCRILLDMLSRWVGFVQDWERDMYFLLLAWAKQGKLHNVTETDVLEVFNEGRVICKLNKKLKDGDWHAFASIYCNNSGEKLEFLQVRNFIAHLHLLRESEWNGDEKTGCSAIEDYINKLRFLLSYDQKRMNAVTKAMQQIFEKHKVIVKFMVEKGGMLKVKDVKPGIIEHLKQTKRIEIPCHGERFTDSLLVLMKYQ